MRKLILAALLALASHCANALCVTAASATLRSGPGTKYPVTWKVGRFTPFVEMGRNGSWYQVQDMDGENQWILSSAVSSRIVCVSVRTNTAKLRKTSGPQGELADIRQVDKYTPFERLDADGEWYQVRAVWGDIYWINENMVWRPLKLQKINF